MEKAHGAVDRVHSAGPWINGLIIKWESPIGGSAARIRLAKGYEVILISIVDLWMDGPGASPSLAWLVARTEHQRHRYRQWRSSSLGYGVVNVTRFLPKWSWSREELVLQTYGEGNRRWKAGDDGVTRPIFNGGGGSVQRRSSSKFGSGGSGAGGAPPPSDESMREALANRIDGGGLLGGDDSVLGEIHMV
jgi:hypothetical protein